MRVWFKRKKPEPPCPTRLDQMRAEIAELLRNANERVDRMLERLQKERTS